MVRPHIRRRVGFSPRVRFFKPQGIPMFQLEEVVLADDELEALRLADVEGLYHDAAAERMNVSRPTFGRILAKARSTLATAVINGKALRIEGGTTIGVEENNERIGFGRRQRRGWR